MHFASEPLLHIAPARGVRPTEVGAWLHETDPHIFGRLHGGDAELSRRHLGVQWSARAGLHSHVHATAAMREEDMLGVAIGYDARTLVTQELPELRLAIRTVGGRRALRMLGWWMRHGRRLIPPVPRDAWYLMHLAVDPACRGQGIGRALLEDRVEAASADGHGRLCLDVAETNPAVRLYLRAGMIVTARSRAIALEPEGFPAHLRLELPLGAAGRGRLLRAA